jgi:ABC-2 type transport system permease protein
MNSMGATLGDVMFEVRCLWLQAAAYFGTACLVYGAQVRLTRRHAEERLAVLRKKREVRQLMKGKTKKSEA